MDVDAERRIVPDRRGAPVVPQLSEDERIEAAQFLLGTRQREEAAVRGTHLLRQPSPDDEEHARETLAEMIHLQEAVAARSIDIRPEIVGAPALSRSVMWALLATLLVATAILVIWTSGIF